ncbi:hypothetical protein Tco_0981793 [Tanacetum coccineum]
MPAVTCAFKLLIMAAFFILDKLTEIVRDLCCGLRLSLSKNRRLIAELEALGHCAYAVRSLGYLREIVGHDSDTLRVLEQLLARAGVGRRLKAGYANDVDETE